jgi:hypothetical protein
MEKVPLESLNLIVSYLSCSDRAKLRQVSRYFYFNVDFDIHDEITFARYVIYHEMNISCLPPDALQSENTNSSSLSGDFSATYIKVVDGHPLHWEVRYQHFCRAIQQVKTEYYNYLRSNFDGVTPLQWIILGSDLHLQNLALNFAIVRGDISIVQDLLRGSRQVPERDSHYKSISCPIRYAAQSSTDDQCDIFIPKADVHCWNGVPLLTAITTNQVSIVQLLLKSFHLDILNEPTLYLTKLLTEAIRNGNKHIVRIVLESFAESTNGAVTSYLCRSMRTQLLLEAKRWCFDGEFLVSHFPVV